MVECNFLSLFVQAVGVGLFNCSNVELYCMSIPSAIWIIFNLILLVMTNMMLAKVYTLGMFRAGRICRPHEQNLTIFRAHFVFGPLLCRLCLKRCCSPLYHCPSSHLNQNPFEKTRFLLATALLFLSTNSSSFRIFAISQEVAGFSASKWTLHHHRAWI